MNVYFDRAQLSRYHRYAIGARMRQAALEVLRLIIRANSDPSGSRAATPEELRLVVEELKATFHLAKELTASPSFKNFAHASELVVDIARQNEEWIKQQSKLSAGPDRSLVRR